MAIETHLVNAAHGFLGMITIGYRIPVTGECFMKKLPWHIPQGKHHQEKYGDCFFYVLRQEQAENFDEVSEL
jgi:hypothetical protein